MSVGNKMLSKFPARSLDIGFCHNVFFCFHFFFCLRIISHAKTSSSQILCGVVLTVKSLENELAWVLRSRGRRGRPPRSLQPRWPILGCHIRCWLSWHCYRHAHARRYQACNQLSYKSIYNFLVYPLRMYILLIDVGSKCTGLTSSSFFRLTGLGK